MVQAADYKLKQIKTRADTCEQVNNINNAVELTEYVSNHFLSSGHVVVYLDYKVLIGKYQNGQMLFCNHHSIEPCFLQSMRVFNRDRELYFWRYGSAFKMRLRVDDDEKGEEKEVIDAEQVLWGTQSKSFDNGYTRIYENRGTEIILPGENLQVDKDNRAKIVTRNYIDYNDLGQAGYVDCRFVKFVVGGEIL